MKRVLVITSLLAILAAISSVSIVQTAADYNRAMDVVRAFRLELSDLDLVDEGEPEVQVGFRVVNGSPVNLDLDAFRFSLYLGEQFMGSNYEPFVLRTVAGGQEETMAFIIPVGPSYLQFLDQAEDSDGYAWSVKGRYKIVLPFKEKAIWLDLQSRWNDS